MCNVSMELTFPASSRTRRPLGGFPLRRTVNFGTGLESFWDDLGQIAGVGRKDEDVRRKSPVRNLLDAFQLATAIAKTARPVARAPIPWKHE